MITPHPVCLTVFLTLEQFEPATRHVTSPILLAAVTVLSVTGVRTSLLCSAITKVLCNLLRACNTPNDKVTVSLCKRHRSLGHGW